MGEITKVCLVIPSLQAGGMERVMSEIAWDFSSRENVEVHLLLYGITREIFYSIPDNLIISRPKFEFNNSLRFYYTIRTLIYLRRRIKAISPQTILSFGERWNSFVLLALLGTEHPIFISDRAQPGKSYGFVHNHLKRLLYNTAAGLIFQTKIAEQMYLERYKHTNTCVIGNPIRELPGHSMSGPREKIILMVGRLIKTKHQDELLRIFADIAHKGWNLFLVGYDHLRQSNLNLLIELTKELGIEDQVQFCGKQNEVSSIYIRSSIFAFTSSSEGFPNAIGEAMAAGLPVVAYDCIAGPSEMIRDGYNGYLVPLHDMSVFAERLKEIMNCEELRDIMGANAKTSIKEFECKRICQSFYHFILLGNGDSIY